jgi:hypothetical protein
MSTILAEADNRSILERLGVLFMVVRIFLAFLPAAVAWIRHHPRRLWIYVLTVLGTGGGSFGWPSQLVGRIYFALNGGQFKVGDLFYLAPKAPTVFDWVVIAWSVTIWVIAMVWATRKIAPDQVYL